MPYQTSVLNGLFKSWPNLRFRKKMFYDSMQNIRQMITVLVTVARVSFVCVINANLFFFFFFFYLFIAFANTCLFFFFFFFWLSVVYNSMST